MARVLRPLQQTSAPRSSRVGGLHQLMQHGKNLLLPMDSQSCVHTRHIISANVVGLPSGLGTSLPIIRFVHMHDR